MTEADKKNAEDHDTEADWREEYDAWLDLIEGHLKAIRRGQTVMVVVLLLLIITTFMAYWPQILFLLHVRVPSGW